jgi:hypothetical protein
LPEIIQFKNGNQIRNKYNAAGQKLSSRNITEEGMDHIDSDTKNISCIKTKTLQIFIKQSAGQLKLPGALLLSKLRILLTE